MYRLSSKTKTELGRLPAGVSTLSVSWLNGRFRAVAVHGGRVEGKWERTEVAEDWAALGDLIAESVRQTKYTGTSVSLVLAHAKLAQQFVEMPPAKPSDLAKIVEGQVRRHKPFEGEAAWSWQVASPTRSGQNVLLHMLPQTLVNDLFATCEKQGLHLMSVVPLSAVVQALLSDLQVSSDSAAMIAGEVAGTIVVVVGRSNGQLILARTLSTTWTRDPDASITELSRTKLYVNQQFGVQVGGVWLFGEGVEAQSVKLQSQLQIPVQLSTAADDPFFFAHEVLKLPAEGLPNLVSRAQRIEPQRKAVLKATVVATAALVLLCIGGSVYCEALARDARRTEQAMLQKASQLRDRESAALALQEEMVRKDALVKVMVEERPAPVPVWLLAYFGQSVPRELLLTNAAVRHEYPLWRVHLGGNLQPVGGTNRTAVMSAALTRLTNALHTGPFHVDFSVSTNAPAPADSPQLRWDVRSRAAQASGKPSGADNFLIIGTVQ